MSWWSASSEHRTDRVLSAQNFKRWASSMVVIKGSVNSYLNLVLWMTSSICIDMYGSYYLFVQNIISLHLISDPQPRTFEASLRFEARRCMLPKDKRYYYLSSVIKIKMEGRRSQQYQRRGSRQHHGGRSRRFQFGGR